MTRPTELSASVVVPAHNEERTIARLLSALTDATTADGRLEIIVVCNGCTDGTARAAAAFGPAVTVLESPIPSKQAAMRLGDVASTFFPRLYVDADVEIDRRSVLALAAALRPPVLAAGPVRVLPRDRVSLPVRWYYDVWERLPQVRGGLFGRGVVALSEPGATRIATLPSAMADDLVISEAFAPEERAIVDEALVIVRPPRNLPDLLRRRVRAITGNAEADRDGLRGDAARTSLGSLVRLGLREPRLLPRLPIFLGVTATARLRARRALRAGDFSTWLRDESSRT